MIRVRLFGSFSELVDNPDDLPVPAENIHTAADVVGFLGTVNSNLHREITGPQVLVAVNQQIVPLDTAVRDGDEVAFLPPVTGG